MLYLLLGTSADGDLLGEAAVQVEGECKPLAARSVQIQGEDVLR